MKQGFDCASTVTPEFWDQCVRALGRQPDFVVRYITRYRVTAEEVAFLHGKGAAVGLCENGQTAGEVAQAGPEGAAAGAARAQSSIANAKAIGAPTGAGIAIRFDVEAGWSPSPDYLHGYASTLKAGGYLPSFYCGELADGFHSGYAGLKAKDAVLAAECSLWAALSGPSMPPKPPTGWLPQPIVGQPVSVWQWAWNWNGMDLDLSVDTLPGFWLGPKPVVAPAPTGVLADVPAADVRAVRAVVAAGLMEAPGGRFDPDAPVTRLDLATALYRLATGKPLTP